MADLPACRIETHCHPFSHTGVDVFGPIMVKHGRSHVKRYGCIFTCLSSRAIHLEIVHSMTADSFLMAFDRFRSRRGQVDHLYSDNGTNFVSASKTLNDEMKQWSQRKAAESLKKAGVDWHFNAPYASHHGGCWERLIRSVKKVLSALLPRQSYTDESLQTLFTEVETIVNSRPLTPVQFSEVTDKPLTPNDLLLLKTPVGKPVKNDENYIQNRRSQMNYLSNDFWQRWVKEYLPIIAPRTKWLEEKQNFQIGDVVLLIDENTP